MQPWAQFPAAAPLRRVEQGQKDTRQEQDRGGEGWGLRSGSSPGVAGPAPAVMICRKSTGARRLGGVAHVRRMQGAGAGIDGAAGKALEAQALGVPPLGLDGVAGAVAGVVGARGPRGLRRLRRRRPPRPGPAKPRQRPPRPNWSWAPRCPSRRSGPPQRGRW